METKLADTVSILVVRVRPVITKLLVRVVMSPSLLVICVCKVCPVVARLPLMSSTILPVETKLEETVSMLSVKVFPVAIKFVLTVLILVVMV